MYVQIKRLYNVMYSVVVVSTIMNSLWMNHWKDSLFRYLLFSFSLTCFQSSSCPICSPAYISQTVCHHRVWGGTSAAQHHAGCNVGGIHHTWPVALIYISMICLLAHLLLFAAQFLNYEQWSLFEVSPPCDVCCHLVANMKISWWTQTAETKLEL